MPGDTSHAAIVPVGERPVATIGRTGDLFCQVRYLFVTELVVDVNH